MKFFKPGLYLRYNSSDDAVADRADRQWERAIRAYRAHLETFANTMNDRVKELAESLCLHDAELLSIQVDSSPGRAKRPPYLPGVATVSVKSGGTIVNLFYPLWEEVGESTTPKDWPFSRLRTHWLYDEIDLAESGRSPRYWHRILLSDGRVISIPFAEVIIHRFSQENPQPAIISRRRS
jgi:hypothetical protein